MRYCLFVLLVLLALELSHSWQTQVPRRPHWRSSSPTTTTQLHALDPELVPALTASTALFVGAAGALFYNRMIKEERKEIDTVKALAESEAVILDDAIETEISQPLQKEKAVEKVIMKQDVAEKMESKTALSGEAPKETNTDDAGKSSVVASEASNVSMMDQTNAGVPVVVKDSPPKVIKDEKPPLDVKSSAATDSKLSTDGANAPSTINEKDVSTVGAPKITPTAEERAIKSQSRDESTEPSFISMLESSQKQKEESAEEGDDSVVPGASTNNKTVVASVTSKEEKPQIKVNMKSSSPPSVDAVINTTKVAEEVSNGKTPQTDSSLDATTTQTESSTTTSPIKKENINAWLPAPRGQKSVKSDELPATPVKEPVKSIATPSVPKQDATKTKDTVKASVATPVKDTPPTVTSKVSRATSAPKDPVVSSQQSSDGGTAAKTVSKPPASNNGVASKSPATAPPPAQAAKIRLNIKESKAPEDNGSSQSLPKSTKDAIKSVSKPDLKNGAAPKSPVTDKKPATVKKVAKPAATDDTTKDTADEPNISLKTILAPEKEEMDEDSAFDSLQQYIQEQARDMTLKRMGKNPGFDTILKPNGKKKSRAVESDDVSETVTDKLPVFMAPKVDAPFAEQTKAAKVEIDAEEQVPHVSSDEEQVAKSLKKSPGFSLTKKARKSVVLVAVATSAVFVGKRLATLLIGRGML